MAASPLRFAAKALAAAMAAAFGFFAIAHAAEEDKGVLANLISRALSSPATSVSIGAVEGVLTSDATIRDIVLSDRDGPWLKVDKARLVWSRAALFQRRLEVNQLTIDHLQFMRRPLPSVAAPTDEAPILPELPLKVIVQKFAIQELSLDAPLVGVAARLGVDGSATLGAPSEGLDLRLHAGRLDAPGDFLAKLGFIPATNDLALNLDFSEPAGGLFAHLTNLPGAPPVKLAFDGSGPLDAFRAKLDFSAGSDIGAVGQVDLARAGAARRLTFDLKSRLEGLAPSVVQPVFAGETALQGGVSIDDNGSYSIPGLHLTSANARLDVEGTATSDRRLDLKVHAGAIPGATAIGKLDLNATIQGPLTGPKLEAKFDAAQIKVAQGSLETVQATLSAAPDGVLSAAATRIALNLKADVKGLMLADPGLDAAVGPTVTLTLRGDTSPVGDLRVDALDVTAPALSASYVGSLGADKIHGHLGVHAPDLTRFASVAGLSLRGDAQVGADLDGAPRAGTLSAKLDAHATQFGIGFSALDQLFGGRVEVSGVARSLAGGGYGFTDLLAEGAHGTARINGDVAADKADLSANLDVPQAEAIDPRVVGRAQATATLTGALAHLGAHVKASLGPGRLLDRPTSGLTLQADAADIAGLVAAHATLEGGIDRHPLRASANLAKRQDGGWTVDALSFDLASAHLTGGLAIGADRLADGALSFSAGNLDDLSPLALTKLDGEIQAKITASSGEATQGVTLGATSNEFSVGSNRFSGLKIDLALADAWGAKILSGSADLAKASVAGEVLADVKLKAKPQADRSSLDFSALARGLAIKGQGQFVTTPAATLDLASLSAQGNGQKLTLSRPASLVYGADGLAIKGLSFGIDGGRVSIDGHVGSALNLKAAVAALPLSALDLTVPGLGLTGTADGDVSITGTPTSPSGDWRVNVKRLTSPQTRNVSLPAFDASGSGRLNAGRTSVDLSVKAGAANAVRLTGSAPLTVDGALDLKIAGKIDAGLANASLGVGGRRIAGIGLIDVIVQGALAKPQARGSISLTNGAISDDQTGFKLAAIGAQIAADGDSLRIIRFDGTTPNGGSISVSGQMRLDPSAGFPGAIHVTAKHAQLLSNETVAATADASLDATGALAQTPTIAGRIGIVSMDVTVPERFGGLTAPIPGTRHINSGPNARARLAIAAKVKAAAVRGSPFSATLALEVAAPRRVFVRGRGIDAELGGDLKLSGSTISPQVTGGFDLKRGTLSLLGKRLAFTRGRVQFKGDSTPELDMLAEISATDVTARIAIAGPASQPSFVFSSSPSLPDDEILAHVLFEKPAGNLSAFQAIQLANAVASLTGGSDAFERLRKSLGVDSLDISTNASGGPTVGVTRAINDRISVGATTGARAQDSGVSVDLDVTHHVRLQAGVDATGGSSVGIGAEWEYK